MVKLVIADDHRYVREAWSWVLSQVPQVKVIAQCTNGREAIDAARQLAPDIILMDIHMEPVNGMEATRVIREALPAIKIIAMSVRAERSYVHQMLKNGANGYVTKNSSSEEMIHAIREVLAGNTFLCEEVSEFGDRGKPFSRISVKD